MNPPKALIPDQLLLPQLEPIPSGVGTELVQSATVSSYCFDTLRQNSSEFFGGLFVVAAVYAIRRFRNMRKTGV